MATIYEKKNQWNPDIIMVSNDGDEIPANLCILYEDEFLKEMLSPGKINIDASTVTIVECLKYFYDKTYEIDMEDIPKAFNCIMFMHKYMPSIHIDTLIDVIYTSCCHDYHMSLEKVAELLRLKSEIKNEKIYVSDLDLKEFVRIYEDEINNAEVNFLIDIFDKKTIMKLPYISLSIKEKIPLDNVSSLDRVHIENNIEKLICKFSAYDVLWNLYPDKCFVKKIDNTIITYFVLFNSKRNRPKCDGFIFNNDFPPLKLSVGDKIYCAGEIREISEIRMSKNNSITYSCTLINGDIEIKFISSVHIKVGSNWGYILDIKNI